VQLLLCLSLLRYQISLSLFGALYLEENFIECVGDYIADICFSACRHRVKLEATFVNAALAVEIMEGIAAALYPDMRVQPIALPLIVKAEMMHQLPKSWRFG